VLNVTGQTRLQDAFSLAQLAKHASAAASASRNLPEPVPLAAAPAASATKNKIAAPNANLMAPIPRR
jgi:hypothetical protein